MSSTIEKINGKTTSFCEDINNLTKKHPLSSIVYSVALKAIAIIACSIASLLGLGIFMVSLIFDATIISNRKLIAKRISEEYQILTGKRTRQEIELENKINNLWIFRFGRGVKSVCNTSILYVKAFNKALIG